MYNRFIAVQGVIFLTRRGVFQDLGVPGASGGGFSGPGGWHTLYI